MGSIQVTTNESETGDVGMNFKTLAVIILGLVAGGGIYFWLFGLAFLSANFYREAVAPIAVCFVLSVLLGAFRPKAWLFVGGAVALPTVVLEVVTFLYVLLEGKGVEFAYPITSSAVAVICLVGTYLGSKISRRMKKSEGE